MRTLKIKRWFANRGNRALVITGALLAAAMLGFSPSRMYLLFIAVIVGGVFLIKQDVRQLLLAFPAVALLMPLKINTGTEVSLNAAVIGAAGLVSLGIVQKLLRHDWSFVSSRLIYPLFALSLISVLSLLAGNALWDFAVPRPSNMLLVQLGQLTIYILSFLVFWLTAIALSNQQWLRRLAYSIVITGGIAIILVLLSLLFGLQWFFNSGIILNIFTVWLVPLSLSLALYDQELSSQQRHLLVGVCLLSCIAIVWIWFVDNNWVGGWFPPFLALGLLLWFRYPHFRVWILLLSIFIVAVLGIRTFSYGLGFDIDQKWAVSGGSRLTLWYSIIELAAPRPILGLGIAAYRHYHFLKPLAYRTAFWTRPTVSAHSMFVDLFAQMGVLGLLSYLWFLAEALLLSWRLYRCSEGFTRGYALVALCALLGIIAADVFAATSLPFVYNMGFRGFRASVVSWMMLGGLVVLEDESESVEC